MGQPIKIVAGGLSREVAIDKILSGELSWGDLNPYCGDADLHNLKCYAVAAWLDTAHRDMRGLGPRRGKDGVSDQIFLVLGGLEAVRANPDLIDRALAISEHLMAWALDHLREDDRLRPHLPEPLKGA